MRIKTGAKDTITVAMFILLLACGSDYNDSEAGPTNNIAVQAPDSDNNTTTGANNNNDTTDNNGDTSGITDTQTTALFGLPQFIT